MGNRHVGIEMLDAGAGHPFAPLLQLAVLERIGVTGRRSGGRSGGGGGHGAR